MIKDNQQSIGDDGQFKLSDPSLGMRGSNEQ